MHIQLILSNYKHSSMSTCENLILLRGQIFKAAEPCTYDMQEYVVEDLHGNYTAPKLDPEHEERLKMLKLL